MRALTHQSVCRVRAVCSCSSAPAPASAGSWRKNPPHSKPPSAERQTNTANEWRREFMNENVSFITLTVNSLIEMNSNSFIYLCIEMVEFCMTEVICFSGESWIKRFYLKNIQNDLNKDPYTDSVGYFCIWFTTYLIQNKGWWSVVPPDQIC